MGGNHLNIFQQSAIEGVQCEKPSAGSASKGAHNRLVAAAAEAHNRHLSNQVFRRFSSDPKEGHPARRNRQQAVAVDHSGHHVFAIRKAGRTLHCYDFAVVDLKHSSAPTNPHCHRDDGRSRVAGQYCVHRIPGGLRKLLENIARKAVGCSRQKIVNCSRRNTGFPRGRVDVKIVFLQPLCEFFTAQIRCHWHHRIRGTVPQ